MEDPSDDNAFNGWILKKLIIASGLSNHSSPEISLYIIYKCYTV